MKTDEQILAKEAKELAHRQTQGKKPMIAGYLVILTIIITLVHFVDAYASNLTPTVQSSVVNEFFVLMGDTYEKGLSVLSALNIVTLLAAIVVSLYKSLADVFGRKIMFIINVAGIAFGTFITFLSTNFTMYIIGGIVTTFFVSNDFQYVYVMEVAPTKWRARLYTMTKAIGLLGVIFIPVMRTIVMQNDPTKWRLVYILPAVLGFILVIPIITLLRESDVFLANRIQFLSIPLATRREEAAKNKDSNKSALAKAFKFLFTNKQARNIILVSMVFYFATMALTGYYESIMNLGGMSTAAITSALFVLPIMNALLTFISGPIADTLGRKTAAVILFIVGVLGFIFFNVAVKSGWSPYVIGGLLGGYLGAYFVSGDMIGLILLESAPTEIRSSVSGAQGIMIMVSVLLSTVTIAIAVNFVPLPTLCMIVALPALITAMVLMIVLVKETKGADLTTAGHSEA